MPQEAGLYQITNVIALLVYSLKEMDGIGYASTSDNFTGYNIAVPHLDKLYCTTVERWLVYKISDTKLKHHLEQKGTIDSDGIIKWYYGK
jgi:hypothetical protein